MSFEWFLLSSINLAIVSFSGKGKNWTVKTQVENVQLGKTLDFEIRFGSLFPQRKG